MNPTKILRELKDLEALETRVKQQVQPNQQMLDAITKRRAEIYNSTPQVKK